MLSLDKRLLKWMMDKFMDMSTILRFRQTCKTIYNLYTPYDIVKLGYQNYRKEFMKERCIQQGMKYNTDKYQG